MPHADIASHVGADIASHVGTVSHSTLVRIALLELAEKDLKTTADALKMARISPIPRRPPMNAQCTRARTWARRKRGVSRKSASNRIESDPLICPICLIDMPD